MTLQKKTIHAVVTKYLSLLMETTEHDNTLALVFPNHLPKVLHSGGQGALGGNVGPTLPKAYSRMISNNNVQV